MIKEVYNGILRWSIKRQSAPVQVILTGNAGGREGNRLNMLTGIPVIMEVHSCGRRSLRGGRVETADRGY